MLDLVVLLTLLHQLDGLVTGQDERLDGKILLADLLHLGLDGGEVILGDLLLAEVHVVVEAVVGGGAVGKVRLGIQALDGLGHDVGRAVADDVGDLVSRALVHVAVVVENLHR